MLKTLQRTALSAVVVGLGLAATAGTASAQARLSGAGATFPEPFYKRLVNAYSQEKGTQVTYEGIGSGGGIKNITDKTVDFAGSDAPMSDKEIAAAGGESNLVMFPSTAGGIVPIYNLPGVTGDLHLTGEILADIYLAKIATWDDAKIKAANPGVNLPKMPIVAAYRTDGSGTTFVFTHYLATQSVEFKQLIGTGKQVSWPLGQGGKGNPGVAAVVKATPGAIGYVELAFAQQSDIQFAAVKNADGKFVKASPESVSAAGAGAADSLNGNMLTADIWSQKGEAAYPISTFTYLIVYKDLNNLKDKAQAQSLVDFLWWTTHDGQKFAEELDYAPLAKPVLAKVEAAMKTLTYKGEALKVGM